MNIAVPAQPGVLLEHSQRAQYVGVEVELPRVEHHSDVLGQVLQSRHGRHPAVGGEALVLCVCVSACWSEGRRDGGLVPRPSGGLGGEKGRGKGRKGDRGSSCQDSR